MFKFTKTGVFCCAIVIMFIILQVFIHQYKIESEIGQEIMDIKSMEMKEEIIKIEDIQEQKMPEIEKVEETQIWQIEIPKISLIANIAEGTTKEILNQYVGHFEKTQKQEGNIGLAGHNRGYQINYFKDLKLLQKGDKIFYKHNQFEKIYEVEKCRIIKDTEWEYLENTEENMLTLITCVENEPEYRRCIQAVEKEEETY